MDDSQIIAFCTGVLIGATEKLDWKVEIKREHLSLSIKCKLDNWSAETRNIDIYMVHVNTIGIHGIFARHTLEMVELWKREKHNASSFR